MTNKKHAIKFSTEEVPLQKKTAAGTRALKLEEGEEVVFADSFDAKEKVFAEVQGRKRSYIITKQGYEALNQEYIRLKSMVNEGAEYIGGHYEDK